MASQGNPESADGEASQQAPVFTLGETIRRQRELAQLQLRQLAAMVGISNPYLSQIERGLREPSEQVLSAIAESLQTTADALSGRDRQGGEAAQSPALAAIRADRRLTASQRKAVTEMYVAFLEANAARRKKRSGHG